MADLDPFGRKKDEDPLASLGWNSSEKAPEVTTEPVMGEPTPERDREPEPPRPRDREPAPRTPREPRPRRERAEPPAFGAATGIVAAKLIRRLVTVAILVAIAATVLPGLIDSGSDRINRFVDDLTTPSAAPPPAVPPAPSASEVPSGREQPSLQPARPVQPAAPPRGVGRGSLLRPYAFGAAIKRLRNGGLGRLTNLRVAPERIDATLLTKAGALRHVQIVPGGDLRQFGTSGTGFSSAPTISLAGIDAGAPQRLTRAAAERLGLPASRVSYLVYSDFAGTKQWNVYFTGGQIFSADTHGQITRRVS